MRRQAEGAPDPTDRALAQATLPRHRAATPVHRIPGGGLQDQRHHALHCRIGDRARRPGSQFIEEPVESLPDKATPPLPDGLLRHAQLAHHRGVRLPGRASQDQARAGPSLAPSSDGGPSSPAPRVLPHSTNSNSGIGRPSRRIGVLLPTTYACYLCLSFDLPSTPGFLAAAASRRAPSFCKRSFPSPCARLNMSSSSPARDGRPTRTARSSWRRSALVSRVHPGQLGQHEVDDMVLLKSLIDQVLDGLRPEAAHGRIEDFLFDLRV